MIRKLLYLLLFPLIVLSCTEDIQVELDSTYTRLVVDGQVTSDTGRCRITLTTTSDYFSNVAAPRVNGADVRVSDGTESFMFRETVPGVSGIYEPDSNFKGNSGKAYTVSIQLANPVGGNSDFQAASSLFQVTTLDSVATSFHPEWGPDGIWTVKLWAQDPPDERNFYMFNLYRNGKLITDTITKKVVSDDRFYNGSYMKGVDVIYLNNKNPWETLHPGDSIVLQMSAISEEYFNFINQVRQSGFSIPFFSGPPANVQGNVNNGGIGFFAAWSSSYRAGVVR